MSAENNNDSRPKQNRSRKEPAKSKRPAQEQRGPEKPGLRTRQAAAKILGAVVDRKTSLDGMLDHEHGNPAYRELKIGRASCRERVL